MSNRCIVSDLALTTLATAYTNGVSTSITVQSGKGSLFGTPSAQHPVRVTLMAVSAISAAGQLTDLTKYATFKATARTGDVLSGLTLESGTAQSFAISDIAGALAVAAAITDLNTDLDALDAAVVHLAGVETIPGAKTFTAAISSLGGGPNSERFGAGTTANGDSATAIGAYATANGTSSVAVGLLANCGANSFTVAVGPYATCSGSQALTFGYDAQAAAFSLAIGVSSRANFTGAIAIGKGATATADHQLVIAADGTTFLIATGTSATFLGTVTATQFIGNGSLLTGIAGGGGMTIGAAVSGGTANRVLHTDGSGNLANARLQTTLVGQNANLGLIVNDPIASGDVMTFYLGPIGGSQYIRAGWGTPLTLNNTDGTNINHVNTYPAKHSFSWAGGFEFFTAGGATEASRSRCVGATYAGHVIQGYASQTASLLKFTGQSSTTADRDMAIIDATWAASTDASRRAQLVFKVSDASGTDKTALTLTANGTAVGSLVDVVFPIANVRNAANDAAAAAISPAVPVGGVYRNGSVLMIRVT